MTIRRTRKTLSAALMGSVAIALIGVAAEAAPEVGVTAAVNLDAKSRRGSAPPRVVTIGHTVIFNEQITTDSAGLVQVLLVDGTTFTIGPNSQLTIDEFVYNPNTGNAKVVATVAKGAFRFIGGQTSRRPGGATIKTPAGSIGIRGAMVEGDVRGRTGTFSMIFGDEVIYDGPGGGQRLFEPGFTLEVSGGGSNVRPRSDADAQSFQASLQGNPGQNGGASQPPTDSTVAGSQVGSVNSNIAGDVPVPTPRPVQASDLDDVSDSITDTDDVSDEIIRDDVADGDPPQPPNPQPGPQPEPEPEPGTLAARVVSAPDVYTTFFGATFPGAGSRGLVGTTPESDFLVTFTKQDGNLVAPSPFGGTISVPDLTGPQGDGGLQQITVTGNSPGGTISGPAYAGRGDFAAYLLGIDGDPTDPFYILTGTETDFAALPVQDDDIRAYSLTPDPIQNVDVAFFNPSFYGSLNNTAMTDFLVIEAPPGQKRTFYHWIDISGSGSSQKSAIYAGTGGSFTNESDKKQLFNVRRGSYRIAADAPLTNMRGSPGYTLPGANGGSAFGPNAEHFLIGVGLDPDADAHFDSFSEGCGYLPCSPPPDTFQSDRNFGTHHVADLVSELPKSGFSRTPRSGNGFMTGMAESVGGGYQDPYILASDDGANMYLVLGTGSNGDEMRAGSDVTDVIDTSAVHELFLTFGTGVLAASGDFGASAFVDDNTFAANHNTNRDNTQIIMDSEQVVSSTLVNPGSYIVSGRAAPLDGYQHCTDCAFADWGWWGTYVGGEIDHGEGETEQHREYVHMGTWVAGDITDVNDLPTGPTNAQFQGTALANIARNGDQYIAAGQVFVTLDLASRNGALGITNLDGANYAAAVTDASGFGNQALYGGALVGSNGLNGSVTGALVNDGAAIAAGTIGQFFAHNGNHKVVGTFMGNEVDIPPLLD